MRNVHVVRLLRSVILALVAASIMSLFGGSHPKGWAASVGVIEYALDWLFTIVWGGSGPEAPAV